MPPLSLFFVLFICAFNAYSAQRLYRERGHMGMAILHPKRAPGNIHRAPKLAPSGNLQSKTPLSRSPSLRRRSGSGICFVHIGKCGGASIREFFKEHNMPLNIIHWRNNVAGARISNSNKIIIVVRDPVARTISAFNWRSPQGGRQTPFPEKHIPKELAMYKACEYNITKFVKSFSYRDACTPHAVTAIRQLGHIGRGFTFYLGGNMPLLTTKDVFLVRNEHYDADFALMRNWLHLANTSAPPEVHTSYPLRSAKPIVTDQEMNVFREALSREYEIYKRLLRLYLRPEQK